MTRGQCLCGAVRFSGRLISDEASICHCGQCRRWSGHAWAACSISGLVIEDEQHLRWFRSSPIAQRGFCAVCGSSLFWRMDGREEVAVATGSIEAPTGLRLTGHIYVADKGDYYDIVDGLPQTDRE